MTPTFVVEHRLQPATTVMSLTATMIDRVHLFAGECDDSVFRTAVSRLASMGHPLNHDAPELGPLPWIAGAAEALRPGTSAASSLLSAFRSDIGSLRWYQTPPTVPTPLQDRMAAAELVGPDGELFSNEHRLGFFVMDADTEYPPHRHRAAEFYAVVAGQAEWTVGARSETLNSTAVITVPSRSWHAIRTGPSPMLCCYLWSGSVGFDDYEVGQRNP